MPWIVLMLSAVLEAVWATALGLSEGFSEVGPTIVFVVALIGSMLGLGYAARSISIGTAYAVWTGLGAALTVGYALLSGTESASPLKVLFLLGIVGAVIGLKLVGTRRGTGGPGRGAASDADRSSPGPVV
ncbi:DMT family transporter [Mycetocola reblochoni]|uniref:Quaternary ammonium compound-resistance protein SugE n=2 Tax=Mycetocola reblochoni TaxID=331618 RepID=A0A1R4JCT3_9MICO|nr:multidrug efflux SMR transporter [Mycetocola reblochoni]RLP69959.1 QacE family quaternary ammonium compound efflux SMR transporter [Mycetocola reblochoni]SJN29842.1 Quaternary ammonium compound-resistance protein SugE [Mycetocola reblochoni REB411]